jgi:hypothetical protein
VGSHILFAVSLYEWDDKACPECDFICYRGDCQSCKKAGKNSKYNVNIVKFLAVPFGLNTTLAYACIFSDCCYVASG